MMETDSSTQFAVLENMSSNVLAAIFRSHSSSRFFF